jgi:hypothetical protein
MDQEIKPYIELQSGRNFYFLEPREEDFVIEDIAHALSLTCRFTGQCSRFYSVAEHSLHVSHLLEGTGLELDGLLHDAGEAYLPDVASPIKQYLPDYIKMEDNITATIFKKFGLEFPFHPAVKHCDRVMLSTEAFYLLPSQGNTWDMWGWPAKRPLVDVGIKPSCVEPNVAKYLFLERFKELTEVYAT